MELGFKAEQYWFKTFAIILDCFALLAMTAREWELKPQRGQRCVAMVAPPFNGVGADGGNTDWQFLEPDSSSDRRSRFFCIRTDGPSLTLLSFIISIFDDCGIVAASQRGQKMLGFLAAKQVVEMGRSAFFPDQETDLPLGRSAPLSRDDLTPQFGYVGAQYPSTNILLLGINPGNGPRNDFRTPADERMMPALLRFAQNPTESNYDQAARTYMSECQSWPVWKRHCAEVIGAGKLSFEQIGYSNCLPWRTASKSNFSDDVAKKAAELYVRPLIEELNPCLIVAMGKARVRSILEMTGLALPEIIEWNRSQAPTESAKRERANAAKEIFAFTKLGAVAQPKSAHSVSAVSPRSSHVNRVDVIQDKAPISSDVIRLLIRENPKIRKSRLRFDCYRDGMTVADYEKAVLQRLGAVEAKKCKLDLKWDSDRHFIRIERNGSKFA